MTLIKCAQILYVIVPIVKQVSENLQLMARLILAKVVQNINIGVPIL